MKSILVFTVICLLSLQLFAQKKTRFSSQNYMGVLIGENSNNLQLQSINGIGYSDFFGGIGVGLDWYYIRSIPLFGSFNYNFLKRGNRNFFVSADAGTNFPWRESRVTVDWGFSGDKIHAGLYWAAGFGYRIGVGKKTDAILLHAGYSYKNISEKSSYTFPCFTTPCPETNDKIDYNLRRLSIKLGWTF